ncbi:MAG: hypothetical protein K2X41_09375 [Hyphomicrobium sp.]|nr:hypothetical protein [Hyphomicrobium sp.]
MFGFVLGPQWVRCVGLRGPRGLVLALSRHLSFALPQHLSFALPRGALAAALLGPMMAVAGCSSTQNAYPTADAAVVRPTSQVAAVVIEDDGLPSQSPPPVRIRSLPDDPNEPYSRNYGGSNPTANSAPIDPDVPGAAHPTLHLPATTAGYTDDRDMPPAIPHDLPPAFRQKLVAAMAAND